MSETIIGYLDGVPIYADAPQQRTAHGADGKFVSGGGSAGGGKHAHLLGKNVTLGHPGGKSIWGGKVIKTHEGFEHDASLVGKKVKVVDVHPNGKHVLIEHEGKRHMWPAKHAHEHGSVNEGGHSAASKHANELSALAHTASKKAKTPEHHAEAAKAHHAAAAAYSANGSHGAAGSHTAFAKHHEEQAKNSKPHKVHAPGFGY